LMPLRRIAYFSAVLFGSILVTVASIVHAAFLLGPSGLLEGLTANVEYALSLIVANLAVVVTTRLGLGGLRRLANRAGFKPHVSSLPRVSTHRRVPTKKQDLVQRLRRIPTYQCLLKLTTH